MPSFRTRLALTMAIMAAAPLSLGAANLPAEALQAVPSRAATNQAPGYYRFRLGKLEVTALLDGTHPFQAEQLAVNAKPHEVATLLARQYLTSPTEGMINAFLINSGSRLILIDTGAGDLYGKDGGLLVGNLRAAGYTPDQIDEIYLTHLHRDHVGGLMLSGRAVFPRAIVRVSSADSEFWLDDRNRARVPSILGPMFDGAEQVLKPYIDEGRFRPFSGAATLSDGIRAVAAPGHTPGHSFYTVSSEGQTLVIWGDTVHMAPVQFPRPEIALKYDLSMRNAIRSREHIFEEAAAKGWWVAGAHISFPGIGHVRALGSGRYAWVPVNYSLNR